MVAIRLLPLSCGVALAACIPAGVSLAAGIDAGHATTLPAAAQPAVIPDPAAAGSDAAKDQSAPSSGLLQEVIVTALRRRQPLTKVPLSVQALTSQDLASAGVKEFSSLVRLSPGLTFNPTFAGGTNIAIRGIGSNAGAATTGIYIDDVPIQTRNLGYSATALYPLIFDLDRIEVLRGPQGTLFGAGSEGGTVRFILPAPSLTRYQDYTRAEVSSTDGGAPSYEAGEAFGGPIVPGLLGFRISAYFRHDGGWIDRLTGTSLTVVDPTGSHYGPSAVISSTGTIPDTNSMDSSALRMAFRLQPVSGLSIEPSLLYQAQRIHDEVNSFYLAASNPDGDQFAAPLFSQIPGYLNYTGAPDLNRGHNALYLPSLHIEWQMGGISLYSTTAYLVTRKAQQVDSTTGYLQSYNGIVWPSPGEKAPDHNVDHQNVFSQEFRVQSSDPDARLQWLAGVFYSSAKQYSEEDIHPNFFDTITNYFGAGDLANGPPFGPGSTDFENNWGTPLLPNSTSYLAAFNESDKQTASFGQLSYKPFNPLTLTAGVRVSRDTFDFGATFAGPENNLNAPFGAPCPTGLTCIFNDPNGYWAPSFPVGAGHGVETAVTPKYTISYQATPTNLFYASAAKGFRPGGGEPKLPTVCDPELVQMGYVDAQGNAEAPTSYKSDNVWDYEAGSKNQLFDNRLIIDANGYVIKWKGVQSQINVPVCGYGLIDNFGNATSRGVDLALQVRPSEHLVLGINGSYNKATFDQTIAPGGRTLFVKGETLPFAGSPWNAAVSADYHRDLFRQPVYLHLDYSYTGQAARTDNQEPGTVNYQPLIPTDRAFSQVDARIGTYLGDVNVSLFVNNLFDKTPLLGLSQPQDPYQIGSAAIWTASTIRPRTMGATFELRF